LKYYLNINIKNLIVMKVYQTCEIKNVSILGSSGAGKTTLAEAMLYEGGVIKRRGSVKTGSTVADYFPVEKEYGYSVFSTVFSVEWNGMKLNFIDCPGSDDFIGGAVSALNVTDTALMVINAQYGVEVGTINQFRYTERFHKPVIFIINHLDNDKADYESSVLQLKENYGSKVVQIQYPVTCGTSFNAVIDVLKMKMYRWKPEGGVPEVLDIPESEAVKAAELHQLLVEAAAEHDDSLMEKFFDQGTLTEDEMRAGIRAGLVTRGMFPVFCVCAERDMCVRRTLEFLGNVVPCTDKMPRLVTTDGREVTPDSEGPASLFFFKTTIEPHIGQVSYFKVISGKVKSGDDLQNIDRGSKERIAQMFVVDGQMRTEVTEMVAGDIRGDR
jgi:elongation factor G